MPNKSVSRERVDCALYIINENTGAALLALGDAMDNGDLVGIRHSVQTAVAILKSQQNIVAEIPKILDLSDSE